MAAKKANTKPVKKAKKLPVISADKKKAIKKADKILKKKPLTEKQKEFCRSYVIDWNATRAYKLTYPNSTDYAARTHASRLVTKGNIKAYCEEIGKDLEKLCGISKAKILNSHSKLADASIAGLHTTWITRKEFENLTDDQKYCIAEIDTKVKTEWEYNPATERKEPISVEYVRIKLYDKQKALDSISKMMGYDAPIKIAPTDPDGNSAPLILFKDFTDAGT